MKLLILFKINNQKSNQFHFKFQLLKKIFNQKQKIQQTMGIMIQIHSKFLVLNYAVDQLKALFHHMMINLSLIIRNSQQDLQLSLHIISLRLNKPIHLYFLLHSLNFQRHTNKIYNIRWNTNQYVRTISKSKSYNMMNRNCRF